MLPALALELAHEVHEHIDAFFRKRVVDRRPHTADRAVTFEPVESRGRRLLDERLLEVLSCQPERHIHQRAATLLRGAAIKASPVYLRVDLSRLALVDCR